MWCTTERPDDATLAFADDEDAAASILRGHLEITGITTVADLAVVDHPHRGACARGPGLPRAEGFALQGRYREDAVDTEWVSRRLLSRMHSYSRRTRRGGVEPATAQDFMRFLLRWQHVAPGTQLTGEAGLLTVVEQLQGYDAAAVAWEPDLLGSRLRRYDPAWLDRLCHDGEVAWLRLNPPARATDAPSVAPSKATPISVVARADLPWLLAAARVGTDPGEPVVGATAEMLEVLRERGACFATELGAATNRLPEDIERALWDGVARGLVMSDGFGAIRARVAHGKRTTDVRRFSRLARGPRLGRAAAGRWSLVPSTEVDLEELTGRIATSWPRPSPSCCSIVGGCCSATSWSTTPCGSRGATCNGRCGAWRTAAWCGAGGSSPASAGSSTRCPRRTSSSPRPARPPAPVSGSR